MSNEKKIRDLKAESKPYRAKDAGGLFLDIRPTGSKFWRIAYRDAAGKVQTKSLGQWPTVTLVAARSELAALKVRLERGHEADDTAADVSVTLEELAREWFEVKRGGWEARYAGRLWRRIEKDALAVLGASPIASITPADLLGVLRSMEARGALDVSKRLRQHLEDIFALATVTGRLSGNPAIGLARALVKSPKTRHRKRFGVDDLPEFFRRLHADVSTRADEGMNEGTRLGLKLVAHVFLRVGELRFGRWDEIDTAGKV